jgi:hypothetical protein
MVALAILGLIAGIVMASFEGLLGVRTRLTAYLDASETPTVVAAWFRDSVAGLVAAPGAGEARFGADGRRLAGLSLAPIAGPSGLPTAIAWSLAYDEGSGRTTLYYRAGAGQRQAIASWPGDRGGFRYCDARLECSGSWPPPDADKAVQLPTLIRLDAVRGRQAWPILAAPRAAIDTPAGGP